MASDSSTLLPPGDRYDPYPNRCKTSKEKGLNMFPEIVIFNKKKKHIA